MPIFVDLSSGKVYQGWTFSINGLLGFLLYEGPYGIPYLVESFFEQSVLRRIQPHGRRRLRTHSDNVRGIRTGKICSSKLWFDNKRPFSCSKITKLTKDFRIFSTHDSNDDGFPTAITQAESSTMELEEPQQQSLFVNWNPPRYLWRGLSMFILSGQVFMRSLKGKIHWKNSLQQLERVGPKSVGVCLLTSAFVGMAFTIQFVREFTRLRLNRSVGGVLALAFARELSPVITSIIVAGRIGSAFAAELGTMQVSEQTDTLRVLGTNPVDYLVIPRVIACCIALPILTLMCFTVGMASSALLADGVYGVSINIILDSAQRALRPWDLVSAMIKSHVFGAIISIVSCAWGVTTMGGAKGVGESTTSAVVISLVCIFVADFVLSYCSFREQEIH